MIAFCLVLVFYLAASLKSHRLSGAVGSFPDARGSLSYNPVSSRNEVIGFYVESSFSAPICVFGGMLAGYRGVWDPL